MEQEEAQTPPSKIARFADTITTKMGLTGNEGKEQGRGDSPPTGIELDLGLGSGFGVTPHGKSGFTFMQLKELEQQALIFKYMEANIPVPSHLVLPIWKSLVSSYRGSGKYPSFLGCRGLCFDYKNSMEPEPGRCRRTDGKKWRCSKDVVPDQKYCERHMHRGRNRSRKHVETSSQTIHSSSSNNATVSNTNLSISMPLQLMTPTTANTTNNNGNRNSNVSSSLGFSPKSVLQTKTESNPLCN